MEKDELLIPKQHKRIRLVKPIVVAMPKKTDFNEKVWLKKAQYAEVTGLGEHLCIEGYFGRIFRSDPALIEEALCEYGDMYQRMCNRYDEAPENNKADVAEVMCWNDLYRMLNLIPSIAGDQYGYVNSEDYRIDAMDFDTKEVDQGEWVDLFREPFYYFAPKPGSYPDPWYLEY